MKFLHLVSFTQSRSTTGCPKSSFLYFISLYFSTIGLGKQIIEKKLSFSLIHHFHTCCTIFWFEYSMCNSAPKVRVREYFFQPHSFCILLPELLKILPCFLWISRKINPLNAKTPSYFREWACIFRFTGLSVVETAKNWKNTECWVVKWSWRNEGFQWRQEMKGATKLLNKAAKQF